MSLSQRVFSLKVLSYYKKEGRHSLPWRKTHNPYHILVSEIMLQQTQVDRVVPKYNQFLKRFKTVRSLANAPLSEVLKLWQGLGYNRRAKMLHDAAKKIVSVYKGIFPVSYAELLALPGVGPYTASAIRVFAYNQPEVLIETNIRSVYLHHFFPGKKKISDAAILKLIAVPKNVEPRVWYAALMDYGAYIKKKYPNPSRRSAHHIRQKPFKGSNRELRGAILKKLSLGSHTLKKLSELPFEEHAISQQLSALVKEGLAVSVRGTYSLPN